MGTYDQRVTDYITSLPSWQQEVCERVRALMHQADAGVQETIKRSDRPYFVLDGNICALMGTKDHVNIFIYDPVAPDPAKLINQGQGNATARAIQVYEGDTLDASALVELFRTIIANNKAGGWRKLQNKH